MQRATRIEARPARRTDRLAIQVLTNCQLGPTGAAKHCLLVEFSLQPNLGRMPGFQLVAVKAGIIGQAAFELYGDDIQLAAIVRAASTRIYVNASYENSGNREFHVTLPQQAASPREQDVFLQAAHTRRPPTLTEHGLK